MIKNEKQIQKRALTLCKDSLLEYLIFYNSDYGFSKFHLKDMLIMCWFTGVFKRLLSYIP